MSNRLIINIGWIVKMIIMVIEVENRRWRDGEMES